MGSNKPILFPKDAEDKIPIDPPITLASSEIISPNKFSVRITSNCFGFNFILDLKLFALQHCQQTYNLIQFLDVSQIYLELFFSIILMFQEH